MSAINVPFSVEVGTPLIIPLDRWGAPRYSLHLTSATAGTMSVQGTLQRINQGETASWTTLDDWEGNALTALADPALVAIAAGMVLMAAGYSW